MIEEEFERRLIDIRMKLMAYCETLDPGDGLSHIEVIESGCLDDDDVQFLLTSGVKVEAARRFEGEPWMQFEKPDGTHSVQFFDGILPKSQSDIHAREKFALFVHRILLEGRNPSVNVELSEGFTLLLGGFDSEPNGTLILLGSSKLSESRRAELQTLMERHAVDRIFDGVQGGNGDWNYSCRVGQRQQARCAEEIVFDLFGMTESVEVQWMENCLMR